MAEPMLPDWWGIDNTSMGRIRSIHDHDGRAVVAFLKASQLAAIRPLTGPPRQGSHNKPSR